MVELNGGGGGESSEPAGWPLSLTFQREIWNTLAGKQGYISPF
jgi:hypothetical protein